MKPVSSLKGAALLCPVVLICSTLISAIPKPPQRLEARQALASITSSAASSTQSANASATVAVVAAGSSQSSQTNVSTSSPIPIVNPVIKFPSLSGCTSGDTGTVTFTSEFAHHTGLEWIENDQGFWNDTGTVWVVQVVSPGYWVQDLGLYNGNNSDPEDSNAISLNSSSSVIAITVPTHGCLSKCLVSSDQFYWLGSLTQSACSCQSRDLRSVGLLNPHKRSQSLNRHTRSAFQANIPAPQIRFLTLRLRLQIVITIPP